MPSPAFAFFALATIVLDRRLTPPQQTVQVVRFRERGKEGELYRIPNEKREASRQAAAPAIGTSHKRGTHLARELLRAPAFTARAAASNDPQTPRLGAVLLRLRFT